MESLEVEVFGDEALGNPILMGQLLTKLGNPNIFNVQGKTLLYAAVQAKGREFEIGDLAESTKKYLAVVKVILKHGADPNLYNRKAKRIRRGHFKEDVPITTPMGYVIMDTLNESTPFYPYKDMIDLLLSYGADINPEYDGRLVIGRLERYTLAKEVEVKKAFNSRRAMMLFDAFIPEYQRDKLTYIYSTKLSLLAAKSIKEHRINISRLPPVFRVI